MTVSGYSGRSECSLVILSPRRRRRISHAARRSRKLSSGASRTPIQPSWSRTGIFVWRALRMRDPSARSASFGMTGSRAIRSYALFYHPLAHSTCSHGLHAGTKTGTGRAHVRRNLPAPGLRPFLVLRAATARLCEICAKAEPQPGENDDEV
jgi:hypothetical protein